jgi:hypothetical protein
MFGKNSAVVATRPSDQRVRGRFGLEEGWLKAGASKSPRGFRSGYAKVVGALNPRLLLDFLSLTFT